MADGNGKIKKAIRYETSDGSLFADKEAADAYEQQQNEKRLNGQIFNNGQKILLTNSRRLASINPSYAAVSGDFFEKGGVYNSLESMITETPKETLDLIISISKTGGDR